LQELRVERWAEAYGTSRKKTPYRKRLIFQKREDWNCETRIIISVLLQKMCIDVGEKYTANA
jgi:hypothetical protein